MSTAYRTSQLVYVAAKLRIADLLSAGPRTCEELAASTGASRDALCRVLRGLVSLGVFDLDPAGRYSLNELSRPLRSDVPGSVRAAVLFWGQEQYQAWGGLLHTVMTGEPAFRREFGSPFAYFDEHPETAEAFDAFMSSASGQVAALIAESYEFPEKGVVVDVGGGEGALLAAVLSAHPGLTGVLLERPAVVAKAREGLSARAPRGRWKVVEGDFFVGVPPGGDVYVLRNVLHDWDDAAALAILRVCRAAMKETARLLIVQRVMPDGDASELSQLVEADLMQMVYNGGRERTLAEYRALAESCGLAVRSTMAAQHVVWLIECAVAGAPD